MRPTPSAAISTATVRQWLATGRAQQIRESRGLSQSDVARALGVASTTVGRWEAGTRSPRAGAAIRLLRLLERLESVS